MLKTEAKADLELREDVEDELENDPSIDARKIGVAVTDGVVTLTGQVTSYMDRWNAERDVERLDGVRGLVNEIEVHPSYERTDPDIAKAAADALDRNYSVPKDRVTVKVANGWVTLKGEVDYDYQKKAAERTVRPLAGVKGITNAITIKPAVHVIDIKDKIEKSFERQAMIDARNVSVSVAGHEVTLKGTVRSWAERREAERAAAATPGVTKVKNLLEVRTY